MTDEARYGLTGVDWVAAWAAKHRPPPVLQRAVYNWINGLFVDPEQEPSQPVERDHPHPQDPVRHAEIPGTWVEVTYAIDERKMNVRILKVEPIPESERD